jgi:hypothetical protein
MGKEAMDGMNLVDENRFYLIQKVKEEIDRIGLKSFEPAIRKQVEKPKFIKLPLDLTPYIEHTLLKPDATRNDIIKLHVHRHHAVKPIEIPEVIHTSNGLR